MAKEIKHIVIDIETLSTEPNAAVIQVGMVFRFGDLVELAEMSVSPSCYYGLSNGPSSPFHTDNNTISWHHKTNPENLQKCVRSEESLADLVAFIRSNVDKAKEDGKYAIWLWACGTDFDVPILKNLLDFCGKKPNWGYTYVRDYRTLRELYKDIIPKNGDNPHTAGADAFNQYEHLMCILAHMDNCMGGYLKW